MALLRGGSEDPNAGGHRPALRPQQPRSAPSSPTSSPTRVPQEPVTVLTGVKWDAPWLAPSFCDDE